MVLIDSNGVEINASIKKDLVNQYVGFKTYNSPFVLKLVCVFS
ncbi:hypothetical protein HID58_067813 [Brassica napus]|uniref:Uncharacterized protein n=1 Tax=Brassica napus TaxID=3708 RepID=A0ABQ7ZCK8_BRANA|nr:hypothetical protein HID58_065356 [Brassica napus]KAH0880419.1 hypothetical protein HID58_067813 [Brassica napus]